MRVIYLIRTFISCQSKATQFSQFTSIYHRSYSMVGKVEKIMPKQVGKVEKIISEQVGKVEKIMLK